MLGCFLGVILIVLLYKFLVSEVIFILILTVIPLVALIKIIRQKLKYKKLFISAFLIFFVLGGVLFFNQAEYNMFNIINCKALDPEKSFCKYPGDLVKSYDNLVGRIDITKMSSTSYKVSYDGYSNDHFNLKSYKQDNEEWPTRDIRILYGVVDDPKIFVIGSAAQGIIKPLKQITPPSLIDTIEINPAILKIMQKDFYEESKRAYDGLSPKLGNAVSYLKSTKKRYDIITLINTHTYRNLPYDGPPDYLHTTENYDLLLDRLTDNGYILFEERAQTDKGRLAFYRMILTILYTLEERNVEHPLDHLVVWSWNWDEDDGKYWRKYYISMIVTKDPIKGELREKVVDWVEYQKDLENSRIHLEFLNDYDESEEFTELIEMIKTDDFSSLEDFDSSIVTNDRPFLTQATFTNTKLNNLVINVGVLALVLWIIFTLPLIKKKRAMILNSYYILIGFAFFFIEIILLQVYQNVFISPSASFIFVLGFLLLSSGIGGYVSDKYKLKNIIIFLIPVSLITIYLPNWLYALSMPLFFIYVLSILFISFTGFLMGFYFPAGLNFAKKLGLKSSTYHFFAINAIAGTFAVIFALYLGIKIGYIYTIIIALIFYLLASIILEFYKKK
ncbi:MAG: MFS transporter [Candidatus Woesearchaeota archaeon]